MFSKLHERLGTAGLIVAVVALVAALGGTAIAAQKALNGKQKKEVTKIAKKYAGKPGPAGPQGTPGPVGPAGPQGAPGAPGQDGAPGAKGATGPEGDAGVTGATGATGTTGVTGPAGPSCPEGPCFLPSEATETGTWGGMSEGAGAQFYPISFSLPVEEAPTPIVVEEPGVSDLTECPGIEDGVPLAEPGFLCVYQAVYAGAEPISAFYDPTSSTEVKGVAPSGTQVLVACTEACTTFGTWAVTAE